MMVAGQQGGHRRPTRSLLEALRAHVEAHGL